jgi:hypothetical protein
MVPGGREGRAPSSGTTRLLHGAATALVDEMRGGLVIGHLSCFRSREHRESLRPRVVPIKRQRCVFPEAKDSSQSAALPLCALVIPNGLE